MLALREEDMHASKQGGILANMPSGLQTETQTQAQTKTQKLKYYQTYNRQTGNI